MAERKAHFNGWNKSSFVVRARGMCGVLAEPDIRDEIGARQDGQPSMSPARKQPRPIPTVRADALRVDRFELVRPELARSRVPQDIPQPRRASQRRPELQVG